LLHQKTLAYYARVKIMVKMCIELTIEVQSKRAREEKDKDTFGIFSYLKDGATTFNITPLSKTTFSTASIITITFSITKPSITTFSITTISTMNGIQNYDKQHKYFQYNNQYNDIQHYDKQHKDFQYNSILL
jgi:hypothetical protein